MAALSTWGDRHPEAKAAELRNEAWGETRYTWGTTPTSLRFTGQRLESSVGLYQMGARWYDPYTSRWTSPDSIVPEPGNPQSWNRYSYCLGSPLRYVDPLGLWYEDPETGALMPGDCPPGVDCTSEPEVPVPEDPPVIYFPTDDPPVATGLSFGGDSSWTSDDGEWVWVPHPGKDYPEPRGTPVYAIEGSELAWVGDDPGGYGYYFILRVETAQDALYVLVAHLQQKVSIAIGTTFGEGVVIGAVGRTGRSGSPHMHIEVRRPEIGTVMGRYRYMANLPEPARKPYMNRHFIDPVVVFVFYRVSWPRFQ